MIKEVTNCKATGAQKLMLYISKSGLASYKGSHEGCLPAQALSWLYHSQNKMACSSESQSVGSFSVWHKRAYLRIVYISLGVYSCVELTTLFVTIQTKITLHKHLLYKICAGTLFSSRLPAAFGKWSVECHTAKRQNIEVDRQLSDCVDFFLMGEMSRMLPLSWIYAGLSQGADWWQTVQDGAWKGVNLYCVLTHCALMRIRHSDSHL